jgi:hypothetical protein
MAVTNFETELGRSVPFHRKRPSSRGLWIQRRWSWPVLAQSLSSLQSLCMCIKANPPSCCIWISHLQSTISTIDYIPQVSLRMSTFSAHGHALALSPTWQTWILSGSQRDPNRLCSWPFLEKEKGRFIMVYSKIQTTIKGTKFGKGADTNKWKIFTWIRTEQLGKVLQKVLPTHAEDARIIAMDSPVQFRIPPHILPVTNITRYDNIVTTHSPGSFAFFVSFLPTHLPIPFRVVKVVKVVLDFNNPMPPICLWSKVTTPGILAPRVPQFHQRQQSVRGWSWQMLVVFVYIVYIVYIVYCIRVSVAEGWPGRDGAQMDLSNSCLALLDATWQRLP